MLTGCGINKTFAKDQILQDVDISIHPGEILALIGPSGGGKTTLLRALSLLDPPDSGIITVDDLSYKFPRRNGLGAPSPWPELTMVFQQLFLWPHLTIRQNLLLPLRNIRRPSAMNELNLLVDRFGIEPFLDRHPNQVSLGQRQRAALVRALVLDPKYLLLDEITSALDVEQIRSVLEYLKLIRDRGTGILLVTHLIGFAQNSADHIAFMENGAIIECGGPDILTSSQTDRLASFVALTGSRG